MTIITANDRFLIDQFDTVLFGEKRQNIDSNVLTDNISNLQTIASTKLLLINSYASFKQHLEYGDIKSYSWLDANQMLADVMTKDHSKNNAEKL